MNTLTVRSKSLFLVLALLFAGSSVQAKFSAQKAAALFTGYAMYVRLKAKSSTIKYKCTPTEDLKKLVQSWNLLTPEARATLVEMFDKWIIGQRLSFEDTELDKIQPDGSVLKVKSKQLASAPFGICGWVDACVLQALEGIAKIAESIDKINKGMDASKTVATTISNLCSD